MRFLLLFLFLQACASAPQLSGHSPCSPLQVFQPGQHCHLKLEDVRVTQPTVGMAAVWERVPKLEKAFQAGKLAQYRQKRTAPVILGPEGQFFITDRHHLSLAMHLSRIPEQEKFLVAQIVADLSHLSVDDFWQTMQERQWVLLKKLGKPIVAQELPRQISDLEDDPYRSLARYAAQANYFHKTEQSFLEFNYADQYRQSLKIPDHQMPKSPSDLKKLLTKIPR
jgi:hypothetical protein